MGRARGTPPAPGTPYHRLARSPRTRWWRTLLALAFLLLAAVVTGVAAYLVAVAIHDPDLERSGGARFDQVWRLVVVSAAIAAAIPAALLAAHWCDRRSPGSVSSVAGHIRWRWLARCLLMSAATAVIAVTVWLLVAADDVRWSQVDLGLVAAVALAGVLVVPFQAAGEEYLFRGYLAQAVGAHVAGPWIPAVACSLLFALSHGTIGEQGIWLFVDRAAFGLIAAWLVVRTGGLEAAIGLHAGFNILYFVGSAVDGSFGEFFVAEQHATAVEVLIDLGAVALAAWLLLRLAKRRGMQRTWTEPAPPPPVAGLPIAPGRRPA